jgi:hypothetical protein
MQVASRKRKINEYKISVPNYLSDLLKINTPPRALRSQNSFLLDVIQVTIAAYASPQFEIATQYIVIIYFCHGHSKSISAYKRGLQTHLFELLTDHRK